MPSRKYPIIGLRKAIGSAKTMEVLARRVFRQGGVVRASVREGYSIEINPRDSDLFVAAQIFGHKEYALSDRLTGRLNERSAELRKAGRVPVIVDGGANVGYSALFFADTYPEALVVALEPGESAVASCKRNIAAHPRVQVMNAALWSHSEGVRLQSATNGSWARFVGDKGDLTPSVTLHELFDKNSEWEPLIVKLDIEGAEKTVVGASPNVFRSAACIMIEPHDFIFCGAACLAPLFKVLADRPMDTLINGENLILVDPRMTALD
jgi:FkbM family methyltransferase